MMDSSLFYPTLRRMTLALALGFAFVAFPAGALRADTSSVDTARGLFHAKHYKEAVEILDTYLKTHPRDAEAFVLRGDSKADLDDNDGALADYNSAIAIDPQYAYAYATRCQTRLEMKDRSGALDDCNQAIKLNPRDGIAYKWRGDVYFDDASYQLALTDYDKAESLGESTVLLYSSRCNTERLLSMMDRARTDCAKAMELDPKSTSALWAHGRLMMASNHYADAVGDWNSYLIAIDSDTSIGYYWRAESLNHLGRYSLALADLEKYVPSHADDGDGYRERGIAQAGLGHKDAALTDLEKAARTYRTQGDQDDATNVDAMIAKLKAGQPI